LNFAVLSRIFRAVLVLTILAAAARTLNTAWADILYRRNTLDALIDAAAADPRNANIRLWLAEHQQHAGLDASAALEAAIHLRPDHARSWIALAIYEESLGRLADAEGHLLHAASIDRMFEPRWALVNFYFRRDNPDQFWKWVRSALEMAYGDLAALWDLCWRAARSPSDIEAILPADPAIRATYLRFLINVSPQAAAPVAVDLAERHPLPYRTLLIEWTSRLLDARLPGPAARVWSALCRHGAANCENGRFQTAPSGQGFDWRIARPYTHLRPGLRLSFDGRQPETAEILWRYVAADTGKVLPVWTAPPDAGFAWRVEAVAQRLSRVILEYRRPLGSPRFQGSFELHSVRLEPGHP
jgi:tetratricopeptide (TPR) repeat protein